MIMVAFLLPVLLGFMAFSIDLGRLRVARVQAEAAADAAALAALAELRDGGTRGSALSAALQAANLTGLTRIDGQDTSGDQFDVRLDWGDWDFETRTWQGATSGIQGVTATVTQVDDGVSMLFAPIFQTTRWYEGGAYDGANGAVPKKKMIVGKRAAMRPRDIVVLIDVSRGPLSTQITDYQDALGELLDAVDDLQNDGDRVGVVVYAGDTAVTYPLSDLAVEFATLRDELTRTEPCSVREDAWFSFYRHYDFRGNTWGYPPFQLPGVSVLDLEVGGGTPGWNYYLVDWDKHDEPGFGAWAVDSFEATFLRTFIPVDTNGDQLPTTQAGWDAYEFPDEAMDCQVWFVSELLFTWLDPRRVRQNSIDASLWSPLDCHEGNYYEGDPNRFDEWEETEVRPVTCAGYGDVEGLPGTAKYGSSGATNLQADLAFAMAGSNPGRGLQAAADMLAAAGGGVQEPTVVMLAGGGIDCGSYIDPARVADCEEDRLDEAFAALDDLDALEANTHVIGFVTGGSDADTFLSGLTTGRGLYLQTDDSDALEALVPDVARSVRLQVVE